jgi:RTX calcium-binding nonapeptide repeat (4 copies)
VNPFRLPMLLLGAALAAAFLSCATPGLAASPVKRSLQPVPSLDPAGTQRQWIRLVQRRRSFAATADCRPLRAVFYAATDWLRLATKLAASASPCAQYYVSVPPLASNKTQPRGDQAWRIRALGPSFHALAEIHMASWSTWVAQNGGSWNAAGQEARRRMATAGYDVALGDTWAVNELSSAVRRGDGVARTNAREFVRGLYEGAELPDVKGTAFIVGIGQGTLDLGTYKNNLQGWLADGPFWQDMAAYVEDWAQELYGDVRNYAVPGSPPELRRDALNQYLQHKLALALAGPEGATAARSFLQAAYAPLANAAWQWETAFGWTAVNADLMQHFVSAQTDALRHADAAAGKTRDHWGLAWAPRNGTGMAPGDFTAQTGAILDRMGAAIRDSGSSPSGEGACGSGWCGGELAGASFNGGWSTFAVWSTQALVFTTPPQTLTAGVPSAPVNVQLQGQGVPQTAAAPLGVTLTSTSPTGTFALSPGGPWTPTLAVGIPAGSSTSQSFYYLDSAAGTAVLTASAPNILSGTQTILVVPQTSPPPLTARPGDAQSRPRPTRKTAKRIVRRGGAGRNVLVGGPLADRLYGRGGNDLLRGRAGNDRLEGGVGHDRLFGDNGADLLIGGLGRDRLVGGKGGDRFRARDGERDVIDCGAGLDRVLADRRDRISRNCERRTRK